MHGHICLRIENSFHRCNHSLLISNIENVVILFSYLANVLAVLRYSIGYIVNTICQVWFVFKRMKLKTILISIDLWLGYATSLYGVHNQIITLIIYLCGKWRKYFLVDFWHDIALLLYVMYPHNWFWIDILKAIQLTKDSNIIAE